MQLVPVCNNNERTFTGHISNAIQTMQQQQALIERPYNLWHIYGRKDAAIDVLSPKR